MGLEEWRVILRGGPGSTSRLVLSGIRCLLVYEARPILLYNYILVCAPPTLQTHSTAAEEKWTRGLEAKNLPYSGTAGTAVDTV